MASSDMDPNDILNRRLRVARMGVIIAFVIVILIIFVNLFMSMGSMFFGGQGDNNKNGQGDNNKNGPGDNNSPFGPSNYTNDPYGNGPSGILYGYSP